MRFCQKCGTPCNETDLFCGTCGADLRAQQPQSAPMPQQPQPAPIPEQPQPAPIPEQPQLAPMPQQPVATSFSQSEPMGAQPWSFQQNTYASAASMNQMPSVEQPVQKPAKCGFGIASLVLGFVSVIGCCFFFIGIPCAIAAVIFGILQIVKNKSKGLAIAGIILGGIGLLLGVIVIIMAATNGITFTWNGEEYIWTL